MRNAMKKKQASKLNSQNITVDSPAPKIPDNNNKQALVYEEGCLGMGRVKTWPNPSNYLEVSSQPEQLFVGLEPTTGNLCLTRTEDTK